MAHSTATRKRLTEGVLALNERDAEAIVRLVETLRVRSAEETVEFVSPASLNGSPRKSLVSKFDPETRRLAKLNWEGVLALRKTLLADTISTDEARVALGLTRQGVAERVKRKELFAIRQGRNFRFPLWQFKDEHASGVIPGLSKALRAAKHLADIEIASWFVRPQPIFEGASPVSVLRDGDIERVVRALRAVGVT
jgi:hypothetical protein